VVLVDEASMATLPNLFYAGCLATEQVILVGDPRQLPPIVQSSVPQVRRALGRTIFDVTVPEPETSPLVVMLDTQYRMHPSIARLVSELYYGGKLKTGVSRESLAAITEAPPHPGEALVLLDTASTTACQARAGSSSRINPAAAVLAVELARAALHGGAESVAVITPYADQSREIQALLRRHQDAGAVECSTVHRFQGRERDVVILDLVDTSPLRPGVLLAGASSDGAAERLLNVSLSRARGKLVIVADVAYFLREAPNSPVARMLERVTGLTVTRHAGPPTPGET